MFVAVAALILVPLGPAANARLDDETPVIDTQTGPATEIVLTGTGPGDNSLAGFQPVTPSAPDPSTASYPTDNPSTGYTALTTFAGIIRTASVDDPSLTGEMYCINLRVSTQAGIGYESGTWDESNVPNVDYVAYILNNYYPTSGEPASLGENDRAAAVQAAIWYFTDGFVVNTSETTIRPATAAIVADALENGPVVEPPAPEITITGPTAPVPLGTSAGPFVVTAEGGVPITVSTPTGFTMYRDQAATDPIADGTSVPSGTEIWIRSSAATTSTTVLRARAEVTVQRGQVYLYDGETPTVQDAQRLILADTTTLEAVAEASAAFFAVGSLTVDKTYAGEAVGEQGAAQLRIECDNGSVFTADIPAGTATTQTFTYDNLPVGTVCTVTEPVTGDTTSVLVTPTLPPPATITAAGATATVQNTVAFRDGSLNVVKSIAGPAAGLQDDIVLDVVCGTEVDETFTIPAGSAAGDYTRLFTAIPAGTSCTVTETETGETTDVVVEGDDPVTVEIVPGGTVDAALTNTADFRFGTLNVVKTVTGSGAGLQGEIALDIECTDGTTESFVLPAGTAAGEYAQLVPDLLAGTECTVTESRTGATTTVVVEASDPVTVTIGRGTTVDAELTNTVRPITPVTPVTPITPGPALSATGGTLPMPVIVAGGAALVAGLLLVGVTAYRRRAARS